MIFAEIIAVEKSIAEMNFLKSSCRNEINRNGEFRNGIGQNLESSFHSVN
jgi:hypothetical protein